MGFVKRNASVIPNFFELSEVNFSVLLFVLLVMWNSDNLLIYSEETIYQRGHALILVQQSSWGHA